MGKYVWALLDSDGNIVVTNGKPCVFTTRKQARAVKSVYGLDAKISKLGNVATSKSKPKSKSKKKQKTYISLVLDKSASMNQIKYEAISHFNEQLKTLKETSKDQEVVVNLITFNSDVHVDQNNVDLDNVEELSNINYHPSGMTALYDAVGKAVELTKQNSDLKEDHVAALVVVVTDGYENSSRVYNNLGGEWNIKAIIEDLQNTGYWTFTYLGATHDFLDQAQSLGIYSGNASQFVASSAGVKRATNLSRKSLGDYMHSRTVGQTQTMSYYEPKEKTSKSDVSK